MVTRHTSWVYVAIVLSLTIVSAATAKYSGGTGEPNDPYQVATAGDLIALGNEPNDYDKHFILTADIDLDPNLPGRKVFDRAVIAPDIDPVKAGFQGPVFWGVFDGAGHTISRLTIAGDSYLGLFGQSQSGADVRNLGVVSARIGGSGDHVGGLVGENWYAGVTQCYTTGAVSGTDHVGGLVGANCGRVTACCGTVMVTGKDYVGGLIGYNCYGTVTECYSTGAVSGSSYVGGLVGCNGDSMDGGTVNECYSTGAVSGKYDVGGLVGYNCYGTVTECYSTGAVSGDASVGGFAGSNDFGDVIVCFWDIQTSGQVTSSGGSGKTTAAMKDPNTFMAAGWDFVGQADGPSDIWAEPIGGGYPIFYWQLPDRSGLPRFSGGTGEPNDPYRISTAQELNSIGGNPRLMKCHFRLVADLDLSGLHFYPIGSAWFYPYRGIFDGNGHTISHLTVQGKDHVGLFGQLGEWDARGAEVKNLGLVDVNITASGSRVGGLVGENYGAVTRCYSTGAVSVTGEWSLYVGGLMGMNNYGTVTHCYSTAAVSGTGVVGGLVGNNDYGTVTHCYSTGPVSGTSSVGGLVGEGNPRRVTHCVWDTQTSGSSGSAFGVGLTTAEMMDPNMLGLNGFANDPNWVLDPGRDYPRLAWEGTPGAIIPEAAIDCLAGQGTADSPYRIDTADQLVLLSRASILWNRHFVLGADIDLAPNLPGGRVFRQALIPTFSGVFDGNNHTISHLTGGGGCGGLFDELESGAEVKNLGLWYVNITASGGSVGGLARANSGTVTRCYIHGAVSGRSTAGGLVGGNGGQVIQCYSTAVVSGSNEVGGLVGTNEFGTMTDSYSAGAVSGTDLVGGLVGNNEYGSMTDCYSTGSVSGMDVVGGLVGNNEYGSMTDCYSTGSVSGESGVGGLVGYNLLHGNMTDCYSIGAVDGWSVVGGLVGYHGRQGVVYRCHSSSAVSAWGKPVHGNVGGESVGGLVGINGGSISMSYSTGAVSGTLSVGGLVGDNYGSIGASYSSGSVSGDSKVGGLVGDNSADFGTVRQCYSAGFVAGGSDVGGLVGDNTDTEGHVGFVGHCLWDVQTSGQATSDGGTGKMTAEMQTAKTFLDAGWDFVGETDNGTEDIWWIDEGKDYPRLWWELPPE